MWRTLPNSQCELGESPFWHPQERALYWVDIPGRALLRTRGDIEAGRATVERWPMPTEPGCIAPAHSGGLVLALRTGFYRARQWGGELQQIVPAEYDTASMRFNDGKCDPQGRFWVGSMNERKNGPTGVLYCLDSRGGRAPAVTKMANGVTTANGLGFAPDGRTLYWGDTPAHAIRAWDWASDTNTLTNERLFKQFRMKPADWTPESAEPYAGRPDGAALDAQGDYWAAMYEGARIERLSATGELRATVSLPVQCPTMPCFGGDDLRTLFVTSSRQGRTVAEIARLTAAGSVVFRRVDTPGLPVAFFDD